MADSIVDAVVLITGAGQGIGADVARKLVARGARVALVDRVADTVDALAAELGGASAAFVADVSDEAAITAAVAAAAEHFGRLDVVVANAGVMDPSATVAQTTSKQFARLLEVNVLGVFHTVHAALPYLAESRGYVLCVSSVAGLVPVPTIASYVASKHAVDGFARSLRIELAPTGIAVGVAYFGVIDTPMAHNAIAHVADIWAAMPGPIGRPAPVDAAGKAIVEGIARRSSSVYAPSWLAGALATTRGAAGIYEKVSGLHPAVRALVRGKGNN
ncbi:SDR family NAD(P)-dependent oxidoreductase [Nocardia sp. NPDC058176]|uniref:SDR family NAD(P)-dependent oxidoreductase n=1 Tax=Nocardia sp. NPDC058176 TaxID=3346368 RepID=UPI0036DAF384